MIKNINVTGLKSEQIQQIQVLIAAFKAQNQLSKSETEIDMIEYLLENPIEVDNLEFMKREEIYDRI
ncbi:MULTISPECIES: hypothetical protein [unclassified Microcystis]|jgi:hypothetical protein|uniref:Uncharacterized protein n=1 Tax=Microcystis flos-aquae Mf_QC_C_20070823_S10D TaxID=2486236 RepID=A0A552KYX0_9CHRO|nr:MULTISPECIES: hypothetical protein [unclassified Microcystis]MCA2815412.1 hypothetical protein [Microcystis sp. M085S1]MCA2854421.1 hypothetical protein [Microcystis sp. M065S1]TRT75127.1 MAG: hypothetical protein EWV64_13460 [Microcystis flos-aquae Ma_QC_C_20070823_S18]TRT97567.1 MAG: hypothetical protein EWV65_11575 [Microcystis flos-aquae Ma_QC_C_20070823_S18D]TRV13131.1 MAG: hypothetical protein EWV45_08150 [Microcystis flos-aquae Mf_QC_C_20070823_S10D]TRV26473.1 MAG: hypothetical prot